MQFLGASQDDLLATLSTDTPDAGIPPTRSGVSAEHLFEPRPPSWDPFEVPIHRATLGLHALLGACDCAKRGA